MRGAMASQIAERYQAITALFPGHGVLGEGLPGSVVAALRKVPRHLFTPGVSLARAYEDAVVLKASWVGDHAGHRSRRHRPRPGVPGPGRVR